jgi:hypothetical protein
VRKLGRPVILRTSSCLGVRHGSNEIEVHLLNSVSERHDRDVMDARVLARQEAHPQAHVEILSR